MPELVSFSYSSLAKEVQGKLTWVASEMRKQCESHVKTGLEIGRLLTEARKLLAFLRPMDEFAVFSIAGPVVIERKAKSQAKKAMGGPTFQKSKSDVLEWASALVGVTPSDIPEHETA